MKTYLATYALAQVISLTGITNRTMAQGCTATAGPQNATTLTTAAYSGSSFNWTNAGGAQQTDASYASGGIPLGINSTAYSNYLYIQNFGFAIPASATICEIIVEVQRQVTGLGLFSSTTDQSVRLLKNGVLNGSDQASGNPWPSSDGTAQYGNSVATGLWGSTWTPAEINDPNFGVAIAARLNTGLVSLTMNAKINEVRVTVIYSNSVLALDLQDYKVNRTSDGNHISWKAGADPTARFTIQRSADARNWGNLVTLYAGSSTEPSAYTYTDHNPPPGSSYYRIYWQTADGQSSWSPIAAIIDERGKTTVRCWPNPFRYDIHISSAQPFRQVVLKNAEGRVVQVRNFGPTTRDGQLSANDLPPGLYFMQVDHEQFRLVKSER